MRGRRGQLFGVAKRGRRRQLSDVGAGAIGVAVLLVVIFLVVGGGRVFKDPFELKVVVAQAGNLQPKAPVRIAGVEVGKVTKIEPGPAGANHAIVTMEIEKVGLPIHEDARLKIRPRLFLEGNFYVDLQPGTPGSPNLDDGATLPIGQASVAVQTDEVLKALQAPVRANLRTLLDELARGLDRGGARALNRSAQYWEPAYRDTARTSEALLGTHPDDLSQFIASARRVSAAIDRHPDQLRGLLADFNTTVAAFARQRQALDASVQELPRTLATADPALTSLNRSFPPVRRLAADARPGVRSTGPTIDAVLPLLRELRGLVRPAELRGLSADARGAVPGLARLTDRSVPLLARTRSASSCQLLHILPWARSTIDDPNVPAKGPLYQEAVKWLPGVAGESRSGDANQQWFRVIATGGVNTVSFGNDMFGQSLLPLKGTNPAKRPGGEPPLRPDQPCELQEPADLRSPAGPAPPEVKTDLSAPGAKERAERARLVAVDWLRDEVKRLGLERTLDVQEAEGTVRELVRGVEAQP